MLASVGFGLAMLGVAVLLLSFGVGLVEGSWPPDWAFIVAFGVMAVAGVIVAMSFFASEESQRRLGPSRRRAEQRVFIARSGAVIPMRTRLLVGAGVATIVAGLVVLHGLM